VTAPDSRSMPATTPDHPLTAPEDGAALLERLSGVLARYVVLPSREASDAVVLWIAASHVQPSWTYAPRLVIRAPEKRCGKSRLLDVIEGTSHRPLITVNASPAAVYRSLDTDDPPTLLIDEADTIFGAKAGDNNEDLRGLLNAGHQRNRPALRYNAATQRIERIPTFAMAALAGIGAMPDTIEDRAVVIRMRRRAPGETVAAYRGRRDGPALRELGAELNTWLREHAEPLQDAAPAMPVEDRAADTWEPLIAVADLAAGDWPARARHACLTLTADHETAEDVPLRVRLLIDCRTAFGDVPALPTTALLHMLRSDPEAPWDSYGPRGEGLTPMRLGALLREYDIRSANIRFPNGTQSKGYTRGDFLDAWQRYCPTDQVDDGDQAPDPVLVGKPSQPSQPSQPRSARDDSSPRDGSSRPATTTRPGLTSTGTTGTAGTATPQQPTCIRCRQPLTNADGTCTEPTCNGTTD
jgi:hypothetical protein